MEGPEDPELLVQAAEASRCLAVASVEDFVQVRMGFRSPGFRVVVAQ